MNFQTIMMPKVLLAQFYQLKPFKALDAKRSKNKEKLSIYSDYVSLFLSFKKLNNTDKEYSDMIVAFFV